MSKKFYNAISVIRRRGALDTEKALIGFTKGTVEGRKELEDLRKRPLKVNLNMHGRAFSYHDRDIASRDLVDHGDDHGWDERSLNTYMETLNVKDSPTKRRILRELFNHIQTSKDFSAEEKRRVAVMATLDSFLPKHGFDRDKLIAMSQKNIKLFDSVKRLQAFVPIERLHTALGGDQRKTDAATYTILLQLRHQFAHNEADKDLLDSISGELNDDQRSFLEEHLPGAVNDLINKNFHTAEEADENILVDAYNWVTGRDNPVDKFPKTPKGLRRPIPNHILENYPKAMDNIGEFTEFISIDHLGSDEAAKDPRLLSFHPVTQRFLQHLHNEVDEGRVDAWIAIDYVADGTQVLKIYTQNSDQKTPTPTTMMNRDGNPMQVNFENIAQQGAGVVLE